MDWFLELFTQSDTIAHTIILYAIVIASGVLLGKLKVGGVSLGVAFVLFTGIVAGHFHFTASAEILHFMQDFGLILFVFCI
ncbi:MAG: transporter, partial [Alloprevotella sp.]|nr:transporter [Alloprevotella sp.]